MMTQSAVDVSTDTPAIRSVLYKMFSCGFSYPGPDLFALLRNGEYLSEVLHGISLLPYHKNLAAEQARVAQKVTGIVTNITGEDLEVEFVRTFDAGAPEPPCPPYEGLSRAGESRTALMVRISEFYKHFGLNMSQEENKRELPDHLCAELEFLHFLAFKEAQAKQEGNEELMKGYLLAQRDFLEHHLARWVPSFYAKLKTAQAPFYVELAGLLSGFVAHDLAWLNSALSREDATGKGTSS